MGVSFKTFGCRLNQYDSEWLREEFELAGFESENGHKSDKDVCVINTCAVTKRACREARNAIRTEAKKFHNPFIIVTGCYAKISPDELSQIEGVDLIEPDPKRIVTDFLKVHLLPGIKSFSGRDKAFVKVQEGCDQFCSYCIVPYARGKPQDRPLKEIIAEVNDLIQSGYKEFILTGTNLGKCQNLLQIIESVELLEGVRRIGLGSIEPVSISDELLDFIQKSSTFSKYFHIPLQSGDNKILKLMGRWYDREEYIELVCRIKDKMPDCAIGADVIVGFPGEGEREFLSTYDLVANYPISRLHVFRYSKRPLTRALNLSDEPPDEVKKHRGALLQELGKEKWKKFRSQFIDKTLCAHIERANYSPQTRGQAQGLNGWLVGVTKNYIKVLFKQGDTPCLQPQRQGTSCLQGDTPCLQPQRQGTSCLQGDTPCLQPPKIEEFVNLRINKVDGCYTYGELVACEP